MRLEACGSASFETRHSASKTRVTALMATLQDKAFETRCVPLHLLLQGGRCTKVQREGARCDAGGATDRGCNLRFWKKPA